MQPCSWEELRLEARSIENELDEKLAALGNLGKLADGGRSKGSLATGNQSHFIVSGLDTAVNYRNENPQTFSNMCSDIEQLLERLTQVNDQMTDLVRKNEAQSLPGSVNTSSTSSSSLLVSTGSNQMTAGQLSQLHTAKRHREILRDYAQEFRQTKTKKRDQPVA
ncbi:Golgi SNAP receptor complex member 1 [Fasciola gigantica]|uniref:Golgi SNAP receptor complex member 1 n=1 Tax=Fasciola gigantica TaxID=46835 RepID=A0A504ZEC7_FASGI|nr:Golgi SNAP receptor complex member 1 [Fasciola gigantica]